MNDVATEKAVLGALASGVDPHETVARLTVEAFTDRHHRKLFDVMRRLLAEDGQISRTRLLDAGIEATRLHSLVSVSRSPKHLSESVSRLAELHRRRRIHDEARRLAEAASDMTVDVDKTLDQTVEAMLTDDPTDRGLVSVEDVWDLVIEEVRHGRQPGQSTGWKDLDDFYTVQPGFLTLVTGIPGSGKTEFVNNLAVNLAREGWRFAVFGPESSPPQRHMADIVHSYTGRLPDSLTDEPALTEAMAWIDEQFVWMDDLRDNTLDGILARSRMADHRRPLDGLIIDPWNKVAHGYGDQRQDLYLEDALGRITRFARKQNIHVWIVAHPKQMRQESKSDTRYEPVRPYDLYGGSQWFNQADAILSLWRDQHGEKRRSEIVDVFVQKVRREGEWGRRGRAQLEFVPGARRYAETSPV